MDLEKKPLSQIYLETIHSQKFNPNNKNEAEKKTKDIYKKSKKV